MSGVARRVLAAVPLLLLLAVGGGAVARAPASALSLPDRLTDAEFWRLVTELSEPDGVFRSDNLVSNERPFQHIIPELVAARRGGAYLGVAPDQNFTYVLATEPAIAFIVDIRRNAMLQHLMYKALFELSRSRVEFVSRLFSRPVPRAARKGLSPAALFDLFEAVPPSEAYFRQNLREIEGQLLRVHRFGLTPDDVEALGGIFGMFYRFGPGLTYASSSGRIGRNMPSFAELQQSTDRNGINHAYLSTDEAFARIRAFQMRNLLVPIVGNFAGPKALRGIAQYLHAHGAFVTAFYTSNVEQYLFQAGVEAEFYANVATLPLDDQSTFIRSATSETLLDPIQALLRSVQAGEIRTYADITRRGTAR